MVVCSPFLEHWQSSLNIFEVHYILISMSAPEFSIVKNWTTLRTLQSERGVSFQFISRHTEQVYITCWILSKLFVRTSLTFLSTRAKFHHISVTRMREKSRRRYFSSTRHIFRIFLKICLNVHNNYFAILFLGNICKILQNFSWNCL